MNASSSGTMASYQAVAVVALVGWLLVSWKGKAMHLAHSDSNRGDQQLGYWHGGAVVVKVLVVVQSATTC